MNPNREIFGGLQGIRRSDQGNYPPYQGIRISEQILDDIGALKNAISRPSGRKFDRFSDATTSPSRTLKS
jgi:hypothetical protein